MREIWILGAEIVSPHISCYQALDDYFAYGSSIVQNDDIITYLGRRYAKKIDRAVQLSLYTGENLLKRITLSNDDKKRAGIMLGNNYASWMYVEDQMYDLYSGNSYAINPYVATAWFPAAAQGELSIRNRLHGISKTFSQDQLSSAIAIDYAIDMINNHQIDYALTGGHESLLSTIIQASMKNCELISDEYPASEGSCSILLSGNTNDSIRAVGKISCIMMGLSLVDILSKIKQVVPNIDLALLAPINDMEKNKTLIQNESIAIANFYGQHVPCEIPTQLIGEISGASFAFQVAFGLWMLNNRNLQNVMIIGRDYLAKQYCVLILTSV